jgi:hypothetical protein
MAECCRRRRWVKLVDELKSKRNHVRARKGCRNKGVTFVPLTLEQGAKEGWLHGPEPELGGDLIEVPMKSSHCI